MDKYSARVVRGDDPEAQSMDALMTAFEMQIAWAADQWEAAGATNAQINWRIGNALANTLARQIVRTMADPADGLKMADALKGAVSFYMTEGLAAQ